MSALSSSVPLGGRPPASFLPPFEQRLRPRVRLQAPQGPAPAPSAPYPHGEVPPLEGPALLHVLGDDARSDARAEQDDHRVARPAPRAEPHGLLDAGITPSVTLYHWDLPQILQDRGGWPERETAEHFAAYASVAAERFGDRVTQWATINEPLCSAWIGHLEGRMAPGLTDLTAAVRASYHLLLGHGLATQAIRAAAPGAQIGIVNNLSTVEPASDRPEDVAAARRVDGHTNRWWLDRKSVV